LLFCRVFIESTIFAGFGAPLNVVYQAEDNAITLTWNAPDEGGGAATVFRYCVRWNNNQEITRNGTRARIGSLRSNRRYEMTVEAISSLNRTGDSATISATTCKLVW